MKVTVEVEIPQRVLFKVVDKVRAMTGKNPSDEELIEFFKQDVDLCYEQYAENDDLEDAVEHFFYVEA